ncbi:MAG: sulfatase [Pseudonocardia sp.]|nr:sulfatase [Pseudonocardia sp.]
MTATEVRPAPPPEPKAEPRWRRVLGRVTTVLAALLVLAALVLPHEVGQISPAGFVRIPVEGLAGLAILLVLPPRPRRVVALLGGLLLALVTLLRILDMGFLVTLVRPFDPVLDWVLADDAFSFLADSVGLAGAIAAAVAAVLLVVAVFVLLTRSVLRLTRVAIAHRTASARAVAVLSVVWLACAVLGVQIVAPLPVASRSAAALAWQKAMQVPATMRDEQAFAQQARVDAFRDTPPGRLLTGLRGKDVMLTFVESYGRSAVEDPRYAPQVDATLDAGTRSLAAAGYSARSAFLTSPVAGGGSWLAHATFGSGLWIDDEQRDRSLTASDRLTLTSAFKKADWQTVGVMPGTTAAWPESRFFGIDTVYDARNLGYRGLNFSWSPMPDQYALAAYQRTEHGKPDRGPQMAEVVLTSSHVPWTPVPKLVPWDAVGDGSGYDATVRATDPPDVVWQDPQRVRDGYRDSIVYSLDSLISWVQTYGDENLVLVFLGDHQPLPIITGDGASRDVPITIVARDRSVLDRVSSWGWQDGLHPGPTAPVWRMDAFRDRFLTAFGS